MTQRRVVVSEMQEADLPFLLELWHNGEVMRYADELPWIRDWSKDDDPGTAWHRHLAMRAKLGMAYTQLVLRLQDQTPIGESFFGPLAEGYTFGRWQKPDGILCLMGDIKLLPQWWNQGLGSEGMHHVVQFAFSETGCELFVVPPHRHNPAAYRVYEKAGFVLFSGMRSWHNHRIMELSRERFAELYADKAP